MKIVFAGTPDFAAVALAAIWDAQFRADAQFKGDAKFKVEYVFTQPDRPAGRGLQAHASAVKQFAQAHDLPIAQPLSLRLDGKAPHVALDAHQLLKQLAPDVMIVAAYGLLLPPSILAIPRLGCINIHASLLPRWRGAAPIHRAIEAGDTETGITIMQMDQGLDTGAMLLSERLPITASDTTGSLHDRLAQMGGRLIVAALRQLEQAHVTAIPQPDIGVTYAAKINKAECLLDFSQPAEILERKIRAFSPTPGASAYSQQTLLKIWRAEVVHDLIAAAPGMVVEANANGIVVACGKDFLKIAQLQKAGGKILDAANFLAGFDLCVGMVLKNSLELT